MDDLKPLRVEVWPSQCGNVVISLDDPDNELVFALTVGRARELAGVLNAAADEAEGDDDG